jgi:O-antigen ligase
VRHETSMSATAARAGRSTRIGPSGTTVVVLLALLPIVVDGRLADAWELPRATLLWVGSLLALLVLCGEWLTGWRPVRYRLGLPGLLVVALLATSALSSALSVGPMLSLVGDRGRYEGFLTIAAYCALLFVASQTLANTNGVRAITATVAAVAATVSAYGVFQYFGVDPVAWPAGRFEEYRAFSTLGNPMYLGEYLALCLPVAVSGALVTRGLRRVLFVLASVMITASLAMTVTRGSWIGAGFGVAVTWALLAWKTHVPWRRLAALTAAGLAATAIILVAVVWLGPASNDVRGRVSSTRNLAEGTSGTRIELARSSLVMFTERPLFGWGPDTYRLVFPRYATLRHYHLAGSSRSQAVSLSSRRSAVW